MSEKLTHQTNPWWITDTYNIRMNLGISDNIKMNFSCDEKYCEPIESQMLPAY